MHLASFSHGCAFMKPAHLTVSSLFGLLAFACTAPEDSQSESNLTEGDLAGKPLIQQSTFAGSTPPFARTGVETYPSRAPRSTANSNAAEPKAANGSPSSEPKVSA
jgi:hypothetical protein